MLAGKSVHALSAAFLRSATTAFEHRISDPGVSRPAFACTAPGARGLGLQLPNGLILNIKLTQRYVRLRQPGK
jgi:hypothetical protein